MIAGLQLSSEDNFVNIIVVASVLVPNGELQEPKLLLYAVPQTYIRSAL